MNMNLLYVLSQGELELLKSSTKVVKVVSQKLPVGIWGIQL